MEKTIKTEGVDYKISTKWYEEIKAIKVNLNIKARDWKKAGRLDVLLMENDFSFRIMSSLIFGIEEEWYDSNTGKTEIDYSEVNLHLHVCSFEGKNLYSKEIKNPFYENLIFYIKP